MYLSEKLIYLELQKTGGSHVRRLLQDLSLDGSFTDMHDRLDEVRHAKKLLQKDPLILGNVRNPLSWYVSLWAYGCSGEGEIYYRTATWWWRYILSDLRALTIPRNRWKFLYGDVSDPERFREWLHMILSSDFKINIGEGYGDSELSKEIGFFTYRYFQLYSRMNRKRWLSEGKAEAYLKQAESEFIPTAIIRMESLTEDLIDILRSNSFDLSTEILEKWRSLPRTNTSSHRPFEEYYDETSMELVLKKDRYILEKYYP
jgi:hypothetical protein